jgi:hypothetical protein
MPMGPSSRQLRSHTRRSRLPNHGAGWSGRRAVGAIPARRAHAAPRPECTGCAGRPDRGARTGAHRAGDPRRGCVQPARHAGDLRRAVDTGGIDPPRRRRRAESGARSRPTSTGARSSRFRPRRAPPTGRRCWLESASGCGPRWTPHAPQPCRWAPGRTTRSAANRCSGRTPPRPGFAARPRGRSARQAPPSPATPLATVRSTRAQAGYAAPSSPTRGRSPR